MKYTYLTISAAPGTPSVYWKSNAGKFYRTLKEAKLDSGKNTLPDPITKTISANNNLIIAGIFILIVFAAYKLIK